MCLCVSVFMCVCVCVCVVSWLVFITLSHQGGASQRGEAGRSKKEWFWERRVDVLALLTARWQQFHPSSSTSLSPCVRVRYKCAGGRKLELNLNSCLDETAGTDQDTG